MENNIHRLMENPLASNFLKAEKLRRLTYKERKSYKEDEGLDQYFSEFLEDLLWAVNPNSSPTITETNEGKDQLLFSKLNFIPGQLINLYR